MVVAKAVTRLKRSQVSAVEQRHWRLVVQLNSYYHFWMPTDHSHILEFRFAQIDPQTRITCGS